MNLEGVTLTCSTGRGELLSLSAGQTYNTHKVPYGWKIWRGIKFGGLAVYYYNRQI